MAAASLAAYGVSMGFGAFVVESAKEEFSRSQLDEEYEEVRSAPAEEIREMICHYRRRGLSLEDAESVANVFSRYEDFWVQHMMAEELGISMPRGPLAPMRSGVATAASFLFFGAVPLLGLAVTLGLERSIGPEWYRPQFSTLLALALSASSLFMLGCVVSRVVGSRTPLIYGMMLMASGCIASILALGLSQACSKFSKAEPAGAEGSYVRRRSEGESPVYEPASTDASPATHSFCQGAAWPWFRRRFLQGLCGLWVTICSVVFSLQILNRLSHVEEMALQSMRVFAYGWLTCLTTGLGAAPFLLISPADVGPQALAAANAVASGMMLAASAQMLVEAHEHCGQFDWQLLLGLLAGAVFIRASEKLHGEDENEEDIVALHCAIVERKHWRKALLIFTVMFFHSAAEGVAVGVAFSRQLTSQFGVYVSLLLAVHNVPEGLAVALVLVPRGISVKLAAVLATLTSVPQPLLALVAYLFVDVFRGLLPLGLAFAAGAMIYVCLHELLWESAEGLGWIKAMLVSTLSFCFMSLAVVTLQQLTTP